MTRPRTIPVELEVSLTRHRVVPGHEAEVDAWMAMLNDREDECVATLDGERMAVEAVFRFTDDDGDWLYWFELHAPGGGQMTGDHAIDRDHRAFAERCKVPGHAAGDPQLLLLPSRIREAILEWVTDSPGLT